MNKNIRKMKKGATLIEYALIVALVVVVAIVSITALGRNTSGKFDRVTTAVKYGK